MQYGMNLEHNFGSKHLMKNIDAHEFKLRNDFFVVGIIKQFYCCKKQDQGSTEKHFRRYIINYLVYKKATTCFLLNKIINNILTKMFFCAALVLLFKIKLSFTVILCRRSYSPWEFEVRDGRRNAHLQESLREGQTSYSIPRKLPRNPHP